MQAQEHSVTGVPPIPAMTSDAERECYYRLAREAAGKGEIIELGAWLGASTAYIAAGIRDSGENARVHVYDKFESKPAHVAKVASFYDKAGLERAPIGNAREAFDAFLGPLMDHVVVHEGRIEHMVSASGPVALLVSDAPKRVPEISAVLTALHPRLVPGSIMAWQDFCHFPSYDIPACLYRIRDHIEVIEAPQPGTTLVFRVKSSWSAEEVSRERLSPKRWSVGQVNAAWTYWSQWIPREVFERFRCGAALFMCDLGKTQDARWLLNSIIDDAVDDVLPKWRYLHEGRADLVQRYKPLFDLLADRGLL